MAGIHLGKLTSDMSRLIPWRFRNRVSHRFLGISPKILQMKERSHSIPVRRQEPWHKMVDVPKIRLEGWQLHVWELPSTLALGKEKGSWAAAWLAAHRSSAAPQWGEAPGPPASALPAFRRPATLLRSLLQDICSEFDDASCSRFLGSNTLVWATAWTMTSHLSFQCLNLLLVLVAAVELESPPAQLPSQPRSLTGCLLQLILYQPFGYLSSIHRHVTNSRRTSSGGTMS